MNIVYLKRIVHFHCRRPAVLILSIFLLSLTSFNGAGAQETSQRRIGQDPKDQEKETIREGETIRVGTSRRTG